VQAPKKEVEQFIAQAEAAYAITDPSMHKQAFNPSRLAAGIYKLYVDGKYVCTATHVGNRMFCVLHALSENPEVKIQAVNHCHVHELRGRDLVVVNKKWDIFQLMESLLRLKQVPSKF